MLIIRPYLPSHSQTAFRNLFPFRLSLNGGYPKEYFPQLSGIGGLRTCPAPCQTLPLYVNQATLNHHAWPELTQGTHNIRITIDSKALRLQTLLHKVCQKNGKLSFRTFRNRISAGYDRMSLGVHQGNKSTRPVKKSPINDKISALPQKLPGPRRSLLQIIVNHTIELPRAVSAPAGKLPGRITFSNPEPEPLSLFGASGCRVCPTDGLPTGRAKPSLLSIRIVAISLQNSGA